MPSFGLFGKMPSHGDFVSRGLSAGLTQQLDQLVQGALGAAVARVGDARQVMSQAAPLMVSFRPGAMGPAGFAGLWYPSHDRVGRVFPLCIGMECDAGQSRVPLLWPTVALTRLLCGTLVGALQSDATADELLARLPTPDAWAAATTDRIPFSDVGDETVPAISSDQSFFSAEGPEESMSLNTRALCSRLPWSAQLLGTAVAGDGSARTYFACRELSAPERLAALFDAQWQHWGWSLYRPPQGAAATS